MANSKNLIPNSARSPKELREMASKGGKKSGEVRRKKADMSEALDVELEKERGGKITAALLAEELVFIALNRARKDQLEALKFIFNVKSAERKLSEELAKIKADTDLINAKIKAIQSEQWEGYKTIE